MEKVLADISRLLEEREFASIEEANAFLAEMLKGGQPDPRMRTGDPAARSAGAHLPSVGYRKSEQTNQTGKAGPEDLGGLR